MANEASEVRQQIDALPLSLCIGWGAGTLSISIMFNSLALLLQRFATDFLGIAAATFGLIYFISKAYDAITDPVMGGISDRTRSRFGRRRPYLLVGGLVSAISFVGLFNAPTVDESSFALIIFGALMILYSTGYTIFNVPYLAMPAEMTTDYMERAKLVSFRVYAIGIGSLIGLSLAPILVGMLGADRTAHATLSWILALAIFAASIYCFFATSKARSTVRIESNRLSRRETIQLIFTNKPYVVLVGVKFLHLTALALTQAGLIYFVVYVLEKGYDIVGLIGLANATGMLVGNPLWFAAARRLRDKRLLYMAASLAAALVAVTWWFSSQSEPVAVTLLRQFLHGMATAGSLLFGQSMLPDSIAHDAARSGLRREGIFAGIYTTAEKFAFAVGGALAGVFLGAMGYVSSTTGAADQPDSAIVAVRLCISVLPALFLVASAALLTRYDLSEEKVRAATAEAERLTRDNAPSN